jgi:predicted acyl esterase
MLKSNRQRIRRIAMIAAGILGSSFALSQTQPPDLPSDIPEKLAPVIDGFDFAKRDVMIPMRDGVKLHTVILLPTGAHTAPILLTRTPYGASKAVTQNDSTHLTSVLPKGDDIVSVSGYIRVFQDVRGKFGSEGSYVLSRPLRGPLNGSATVGSWC